MRVCVTGSMIEIHGCTTVNTTTESNRRPRTPSPLSAPAKVRGTQLQRSIAQCRIALVRHPPPRAADASLGRARRLWSCRPRQVC